jgi:hypothetical protein
MPEPAKPVSPEDVFAAHVDGGEIGGTYVRKGSIASFIQNARTLSGTRPGTAEYDAIVQAIRDIKPTLDALELFDVFELRDPQVARIVDGA